LGRSDVVGVMVGEDYEQIEKAAMIIRGLWPFD
jgi:hypothetical protein